MTRVKKIAIHNVVHSIEGDSSIVVANQAIPDNWKQASTMSQLITRINDDDTAIEGKTYVGTVSYSDLPEGLLQAELKIEITKGSTSGNKIIVFTIESENISPYHWERVSAYGRSGNWRSFLPNKTIDTTVTSGSSNLITSNAVYNAVASKLNGTVLTKTEYDAIQNKDVNKIYVVEESLANGVYILYTDGSLSAYNSLTSGKTPIGSVLKTDNVSIVIHPNEGENKSWSSDPYTEVSGVTTVANRVDASVDYDGKTNTAAIITAGKNGTAFDFCTTLGGYLPSCGEMEQIRLNAANINTSLNLINGTVIDFDSKAYWTSTQRNSANAWYWIQPQKVWYSDIKTMNIYCRSVESFTSSLTYKLYQGTSLIASSDNISSISELNSIIANKADSSDLLNKADGSSLGYPIFDENTNYAANDTVFYNGKLYFFNQAHNAGAWDSSEVSPSSIKASLNALTTSKVDRVQNAANGNFATLNSSGNITDSGISASEINDIKKQLSTPTFGGLEFSKGPLYYNGTNYELKDDWTICSYGSKTGKIEGSTYFTFPKMGELFEKSGFGNADGNIDNLLDPLNGWRMPTKDEYVSLYSNTRNGSTVNNIQNVIYAVIQVTDITFAGQNSAKGVLFFPDDIVITGATLTVNNSTVTDITTSQLNEYLNQGCIFIPLSGNFGNGDWEGINSYCRHWTSTESSTGKAYWFIIGSNGNLGYSDFNKDYSYTTQIRLVRTPIDLTNRVTTLESTVSGIETLLAAI